MKKLSKMISTKDIRKASFLCAVFCLSVFMMACANNKTVISEKTSGTEWMMTDSILVKQIDDSLKYVLFDPDTVKCYHISYKEKIKEKEYEVVKDYIRDSLISVLSASQISVLQYVLLSDATNYLNDTILVQSPYLPTLEFEFGKKNQKTVSVVISTLDRSWQIVCNGKLIHTHNIAATKQVERFCNYFMNIFERKEDKK